jgi:hypothetical protein
MKIEKFKEIFSLVKHYMTTRFVYRNIKNGFHSRFPLCCIAWHTFVHAPHFIWLAKYFPYMFDIAHPERLKKDRVNYVRCPMCLKFDFKIKNDHSCKSSGCLPSNRCADTDDTIEMLRFMMFRESREHYRNKL